MNAGEGGLASNMVSVIVPCYNAAKTIRVQLDALARQKWPGEWEVIIADNGSTDESLAIVEQYRDKLPNLRIVDASGRRGQPYAMNVGARAAKGEALLFCDADDEVGDGWLAAMGEALSTHDFVACRTESKKLNPPWLAKGRSSAQENGLQKLSYVPQLYFAGSGTMGIKRSLLFDVAGGFDENLPMLFDSLLCVQLQLAGKEIHYVPDAVLHLRHRETLSDGFRQGFNYGQYQPVVYKRAIELGNPRLPQPWKMGIRGWHNVLAMLPMLRDKAMQAAFVFRFGRQLGRIKGSIKQRVFYF